MKKHLFPDRVRVFTFYIIVVLGITLIGNNPSFAQNTDPDVSYRDHLKKGDTYLAAKNYAAAMFEYEKASDLKPEQEEPKLKMQSIEATLGINELAEVKRKVALAKQQEQEQLKKAASATASPQPEKAETAPVAEADKPDMASIRKGILDSFAEALKRVEKGNDMTAKATLYRKIADAFKNANDEEMVLEFLNKALAAEMSVGKQENIAIVYEEIADTYYEKGDFASSIDNFEKSLDIKEKAGDKAGASKVLSNIANVYETTYDYKNAIDYYQQSKKIKENIKDDAGLKDIENNLGDVYYKQKVLTSSIMSYEKAVDIIQKLNMDEALGSVYNKLGVAHYEMGNYEEAEKFFKESMKNLNENGNRKEAAMALNNLGNLLFINNKYSDAVTYYERSLLSKKESGYNYGQAVTLFNLGNAYRRSGDQKKAIKCYETSRRIADSLNMTSLKAKSTKALSVSYNAAKDFTRASEMEQELNDLNAGSVSIEIPVSENEMDLELDKTQKILSKLNEEALKRKESIESGADDKLTDMYINNINSQYLKEQSRNRMLIIIAAALGTLLLGVLFLYARGKRARN